MRSPRGALSLLLLSAVLLSPAAAQTGQALAHYDLPIARILPRLVPTQIGMFGLGDAGRVWADGTDSRRVNRGTG